LLSQEHNTPATGAGLLGGPNRPKILLLQHEKQVEREPGSIPPGALDSDSGVPLLLCGRAEVGVLLRRRAGVGMAGVLFEGWRGGNFRTVASPASIVMEEVRALERERDILLRCLCLR
jgi:hypothetical protein